MNAPGFWELVFLAVLALLIFGPQRLPEIARNVGKAIGQFKREASNAVDELKRAADYEEFKGVTRDLKQTGAELKRGVALTTPAAARARRGGGAPADATPFDPEAT